MDEAVTRIADESYVPWLPGLGSFVPDDRFDWEYPDNVKLRWDKRTDARVFAKLHRLTTGEVGVVEITVNGEGFYLDALTLRQVAMLADSPGPVEVQPDLAPGE